jgi:hypothetical protein
MESQICELWNLSLRQYQSNTAYPVVEQVAYQLGAHAFLRKTAKAKELISTITSILQGNSPPLTFRTERPSPTPDTSSYR